MSGRYTSVGLFFSLMAIALAANHANDGVSSTNPERRSPASFGAATYEKNIGPFKSPSLLRHTEKLRGPLSVKLEMIGGTRVANVGEEFVLRGVVTSRSPLDATSYSWSIPEGLEVVNGAINGVLTAISANEPAVVEVTLRKTVAENLQVHLMASSSRDGMNFGDAAQFNTDIEEMLQEKKVRMRETTEKAVQTKNEIQSKKSALKIYH